MIELGGLPSLCGVAIGAIESKSPFMRLVAPVARIAILQGRLEVSEAACVDVALHAGKPHMLTGNLERKYVMIEIFPETIYAIMTIETGGTKRQVMRGHESQVHLTMTAIARFQSEGCDVTMMTVIASKWFPRSCTLMAL